MGSVHPKHAHSALQHTNKIERVNTNKPTAVALGTVWIFVDSRTREGLVAHTTCDEVAALARACGRGVGNERIRPWGVRVRKLISRAPT